MAGGSAVVLVTEAISLIIVVTLVEEREVKVPTSIAPGGCALGFMLAIAAVKKVEDVVEHRELLAARPGHKKPRPHPKWMSQGLAEQGVPYSSGRCIACTE